jgi:hypothetical protein
MKSFLKIYSKATWWTRNAVSLKLKRKLGRTQQIGNRWRWPDGRLARQKGGGRAESWLAAVKTRKIKQQPRPKQMTNEVWKAAAGYASPESDNDRPSDVDDVQTQRINDQLHSLGRRIFWMKYQ